MRMIIVRVVFYVILVLSFPLQAQDKLSGYWPREFVNADGSVTVIPEKPKRILSTSVTVTGTLLAINAPLVASASDGRGDFFQQWKSTAEERQLDKLWPAGSIDLEMVYSVAPDLIIVSYSGGDSAKEQMEALSLIAPTIMVDYGKQTWQKLATRLGEAMGMEESTQAVIADFDEYLDKIRNQLSLPDKQANIISYHGAGIVNPIAKTGSPHAQLLKTLGFEIEGPDPSWETYKDKRNDFVRAHYENLTLLKAPVTFLIVADQNKANKLMNDPVLANMPSVKKKQVYGLGLNSFRVDYFSALEIIDTVSDYFRVHR